MRDLFRLVILLIVLGFISPALGAPEQLAPRTFRVVDGDTIEYGRVGDIRIVGYDTPEIEKGTKGYQCLEEYNLGMKAKARLSELLAPPNVVTLKWSKGRDKYGRRLAQVYSNHKNVGPILIKEGLAHPYTGKGKRPSWCPAGAKVPDA